MGGRTDATSEDGQRPDGVPGQAQRPSVDAVEAEREGRLGELRPPIPVLAQIVDDGLAGAMSFRAWPLAVLCLHPLESPQVETRRGGDLKLAVGGV